MRQHWLVTTALALGSAMVLAAAHGQVPAPELDADEILVFDGETRLSYPGDPALDLSSPATLEFWVSPAWDQAPAYDPCVLASMAESGLIFSVHITADRKALGIYDGTRFDALEFDFSDGLMHRVLLSTVAPEVTEVEIDGDTIGLLALGLGRGQASRRLHLGSLDGEQAPFVGALARVRVWDAVLDENTTPESLRAQTRFSPESLALAVYQPLAGSFAPAPDAGGGDDVTDEELGVTAETSGRRSVQALKPAAGPAAESH